MGSLLAKPEKTRIHQGTKPGPEIIFSPRSQQITYYFPEDINNYVRRN